MSRVIVVASKNPKKLRELNEVLAACGVACESLDAYPDIPEAEETCDTFVGNAREKAMYYARATGQWALADDSGLVVDALDGAPGVYSARYAAERCGEDAPREEQDAANNAKLLDELSGVAEEDRTARFVCYLALSDGETILAEARGTMEGRISTEPAGCGGFGYDPLFYLPERGRSSAELTTDEKHAVSHRGKALRTFAADLPRILEVQS